MNRLSGWKKRICITGMAAAFVFAGIFGNPAAVWAEPATGKINTDNVRVRAQAVDGDLVGSLQEGESVTITGDTEGSDGHVWYQVTFAKDEGGKTGWIREDLVDAGRYEPTGTFVETDADEDTETDTEPEGFADGAFVVDGTGYDIAESIPEDVIPEGFFATTIVYGNEEVPALQNEAGSADLFYLQKTSDASDKSLFVYDEERNEAVPFIRTETKNGYIVLLNVPEDEVQQISDRFVETTYKFEKGSVMAYQLAGTDDLVADDAAISDIYYVYGVNENGEQGWYIYDAAQNSIQRSVTNMHYSAGAEEVVQETPDENTETQAQTTDSSLNRMVVAALAVICLLLLILVIIFSVRYRRLRKDVDEDPDEYEYISDAVKERTGKTQQHREDPEKIQTKKEQPAENNQRKRAKEEAVGGRKKDSGLKPEKEKTERNKKKKGLKEAEKDSIELFTPVGKINLMNFDDMEDASDEYYDDFEDLTEEADDSWKHEPPRKDLTFSEERTAASDAVQTRADTESVHKDEPGEETRNLENLIGVIVAAEEAKAAEEMASREMTAEEEAVRQRAVEEQATRQRAAEEEEARQRAAEEEAARQRAAEEEAARRRAAEEDAARQRAAEEEAARRRAAEEEAARQRAAEEEAVRQRAAEEEAARQRAAEEAARQRAAEEEAARQRAEEEAAGQSEAAQELVPDLSEEENMPEDITDRILREADRKETSRAKTERDIEDILNQGFKNI